MIFLRLALGLCIGWGFLVCPSWGYYTDFPDASGWTLDGLWAVDGSPSGAPGGAYQSYPLSLNFNDGTDFDVGVTTSGTAVSPVVDLTGISSPVLKFACNYKTETSGTYYDQRYVIIQSSDGTVERERHQLAESGGSPSIGACSAMGTWHVHSLNLNNAWGQVRILFTFDTRDSVANAYAGWFIDNLVVGAVPFQPPTNAHFQAQAASGDGFDVEWSSFSDPSARFTIALASGSNFDPSSIISSGTTANNNNTTSYAGLSLGRQYFFKIKVSTDPDFGYSSIISTVTKIGQTNLAAPKDVAALPFSDEVNTVALDYSLDQISTDCVSNGNRDVWYKRAPNSNETVEVNTSGSDASYERVVVLWNADPTPDVPITCNSSYWNGNRLFAQLAAGSTYLIQVYSQYSSPGGNLKLGVLSYADATAPGAISDLTALKEATAGSLRLEWSAPGDDGSSGIFTDGGAYDVRFSTSGPISNTMAFSSATPVTSSPTFAAVPAPYTAGVRTQLWLNGLPERTTVWFAIRTRDEVFNRWSSLAFTSQGIVVPGSALPASNTAPGTARNIGFPPFNDELNTIGISSAADRMPDCGVARYPGQDVWYRFVSTITTTLIANTFGSNYDTILQVWRSVDGTGSNLTSVICNDDEQGFGFQSRVSFPLSSSDTYYFQILGAYTYSGSLKFQVSMPDSVPPGKITSLAAVPGNNPGDINLSWVAPANDNYDGVSGAVTRYFVRYSSLANISASNWSSSGSVKDPEALIPPIYSPAPLYPGSQQTMNLGDLSPGVTYWFAVRALDSAGNISQVSNSPQTFAKPQPVAAGDGEGTAVLNPASVPVSEIVWTTLTFTVGASSIQAGGAIELTIPENWGTPQTYQVPCGIYCGNSYTTATVIVGNAQVLLTLETPPWPDRPKIVLTVSTGSTLVPNNKVDLYFQNTWSQYNKQNGILWKVRSRGAGGVTNSFKEIAAQPTMNAVAGSAKNVGFSSWEYITLGSNQASPALSFRAFDASWQETAMPSPAPKVRVYAITQDSNYAWTVDPNAQIGFDKNFVSVASAAHLSGHWLGSNATFYNLVLSTPSFYYRTTSTGSAALMVEYFQQGSYGGNLTEFGVNVATNTIWRSISIKSQSLAISNLVSSPTTITPDGDGTDDFLTVKFTITDTQTGWRVRISSDPALSQETYLSTSVVMVFDWSGVGDPYASIPTWYGMDYQGRVVPNGTYYVRAENNGGGVAFATATITVSAAYIGGSVQKNSVGVANVFLSAQGTSAQSGYVYRSAVTDGNGNYTIRGLKSGVSYQVFATYYDTTTFKSYSKNQTFTCSNQSNANLTFEEPTQIRVHVTVSSAPTFDQWGSANAFDSSGVPQAWGQLRVQAGQTESDSGWSQSGFPSSWTVLPVNNTGNYKIRAEMFGYASTEAVVAVTAAGQTKDIVLAFVKKPSVFGNVMLPTNAIQQWGTWVSVEGVKQGQTFPSVYGGAWFSGGGVYQGSRATAAYVLNGVDPSATYTFKARAQGIGTVSSGPVVVGNSDIGTIVGFNQYGQPQTVSGGVDLIFSTQSAGITGVVEVVGNTSSLPQWMLEGSSFTLWVNAWSPTNYSYASAQVKLLTSATYSSATYSIPGLEDGTYQVYAWLQGFEFNPPGPQIVKVVGGVGTRNLRLEQYNGVLKVFLSGVPTPGGSFTEFNKVSLKVTDDSGYQSYFNSDNVKTLASPQVYREYSSSASVRIPNLGTGFYRVRTSYQGNGVERSQRVSVVNNSTSTLAFDLSATTYAITGRLASVNFTLGTGSTTVTISSASGLLAVTAGQFDMIYIGSGNIALPIARIEAFERDLQDFGNALGNMVGIAGTAGVETQGIQHAFGKVKYGLIDSSGNYRIDSLTPGVYLLRHPTDLDPQRYNGPELAADEKVVLLKGDGSTVVIDPPGENLDFSFQGGTSINGTVKLPSDVPSDNIGMSLVVKNKRREIVSWQWLQFNNNNQVSYTISKLANGDYTAEVLPVWTWDNLLMRSIRKYVAKPISFTLPESSPKSKDIQLLRPGSIKGKLATEKVVLQGTTTVKTFELVTERNLDILPDTLRLYGKANPWVEGGYVEAEREFGGLYGGGKKLKYNFDPNNQDEEYFWITGLLPDMDYDVEFQQDSFSTDALGKGQLNFVPVKKSGIRVGANQIVDMGTIQLEQGLTVNGQVTDGSGTPLANVKVKAVPSAFGGREADKYTVQTFTNEKGSYSLSGMSYDLRYYDIVAAPRERTSEGFQTFDPFAQVQQKYGQSTRPNFDVRIGTTTVDFQLSQALATIKGKVRTSDGKPLSLPFGQQKGYPGALVLANKVGDIPRDNPLGDVETISDTDGNFLIDRLGAGDYQLFAMSLGYAMSTMTVSGVTNALVDIGTITVQTGLTISGTIVKPDGTKPSTDELGDLVAANADFTKIAIGNLKVNQDTKLVEEYSIPGIESGVAYTIAMFLGDGDDMVTPPEGAINITTHTVNYKLTFTQTDPGVFITAKKVGQGARGGQAVERIEFTIELTQALRNKTVDEQADDYWSKIVTFTPSGGSAETGDTLKLYAEGSIEPNRKKVTVTYTPPPSISKVTLRFTAPTAVLKPGTQENFQADVTFDFYVGLAGQKNTKVSAVKGGTVKLDNDASSCQIQGGSFLDASGNPLAISSNVSVGLQKADDVATTTGTVKGAPALAPGVEETLPPIMARAIKTMKQVRYQEEERVKAAPGLMGAAQNASEVAGGNVLGSFYDFFLPAGVRRQLAKNATVTLAYSSPTADVNTMNVYFYNDTSSTMTTTDGTSVPPGSYGKEDTNRAVDNTNKTITVSVNHFTVYVVVNSTQSVLGGSVTTVTDTSATSSAFSNSGVNQVTLQRGTTFTYTGVTVSGGASENHGFTLISTGSANAGILMNIQSHLQTFSLAVNQEQLVDLNDDGLKDINFKILSVHPSSAVASISGLSGLSLPTTVDYSGAELEAFNFPNPFNAGVRGFLFTGNKTVGLQTLRAEGATAVRYALPSNLGAGPVRVTLEIYDVSGEVVKRLDFGSQTTGKYHYGDWDGKNEDGQTVASGVYIGRLSVEGSSRTKTFKMAVIK